ILAAFTDDAEIVHHPTGASWDRKGVRTTWSAFVRAKGGAYQAQVLASLGDSLALYRSSLRLDAITAAAVAPFGPVEKDEIALAEVDAQGRRTRTEYFAADRLLDAVVRLYERHAELVSDGAERTAATALVSIVKLLCTGPAGTEW